MRTESPALSARVAVPCEKVRLRLWTAAPATVPEKL